jgi:hypothetical protein
VKTAVTAGQSLMLYSVVGAEIRQLVESVTGVSGSRLAVNKSSLKSSGSARSTFVLLHI